MFPNIARAAEEAQELAARWEGLRGPDQKWLFAWVRALMSHEAAFLNGCADPKSKLVAIVGAALALDSEDLSHSEYLDRSWDLCAAAQEAEA